MNLNDLLDSLYHPDLKAIDISLDRITRFLGTVGHPEKKLLPVIHVAGTNGKGSLVAYLQAILQAAGLRVHRYTSPHLVRFNERIVINGQEVDDAILFDLLTYIKKKTEQLPLTFFEATTVAAFMAFAKTPADILLLEVGLGGRLDATNVIDQPMLTAITPVSLDHCEFLGNTLAAIATEKAGIMKKNVPCVVGPQLPEAARAIEEYAVHMCSPLFRHGREWQAEALKDTFIYRSALQQIVLPRPSLAGEHQIYNAATAVACMEHLPFAVKETHIREGLAHARWPARLQKLTEGKLTCLLPQECELWLDGGHNAAAGMVLGEWMASHPLKPVYVIAAMVKRKDGEGFFAPLAPHAAHVYTVSIPDEPQSKTALELAQEAAQAGIRTTTADTITEALKTIANTAKPPFIVLICGSLYLAGAVLAENN